MTAADTTQTATFSVDAPADLIELAAPIVAIHLAISQTDAAAQLRQGQVLMANGRAAARLVPLLQALGFAPRIVSDGPVDIALQVAEPQDVALLVPALARVLQRDEAAVQAALRQPGGIVLHDLTQPQTADLRQRLRPLRGLRLTEASGLSDLFAIAPLDRTDRRAFSRHLAVLGLVPCRFTGALATGLSAVQVAQLRARFDDAGLRAVNRAFQRFDLFLTGTEGLPAEEVVAFLSTRADLSGALVEGVTPLTPLQIEHGLTRASAIQFRADYAAIGLETCARLASF